MKLPNPLAVSKQEAYLAIKSGKLMQEQYDEVYKPSLLNPDNNFEAWLAKWCELVEDYPKDENNVPLCLCDEEALVAYLCGVKTTYPADHQNPMDVRLAAYLRYLINGIYGRPEYPVTTSEYWLAQMDAPNITNDTPSASFELNGTAEAPLLDLKAFGDTSQNTTSGKNLIPYPYFYGDSRVTNGITFTAASDGSITLNGTNNGNGNSYYYMYSNVSSPLQLEAGNYYFIPPSSTSVGYTMYDGTTYYNFMSSNGYSITLPTTTNIREFYVQVPRNNTTVFDNLKVYPMLVRNLIDLSKGPDYKNLATATYTANSSALSIASDTSTTAGNRFCGYYLTNLTKGAEYRLSIKSITTSIASGTRVAMIRSYNGSSATEITTIPNSSDLSATFKVPDNSQRIEVFFYTTQGTTSVFNGVWLEAGTAPDDFEPYTGGTASPNPDYPQEVNTVTGRQVVKVGGKNLLDTSSYQDAYINGTGGLANGGGTNALFDYVKLDSGKSYTASASAPVSSIQFAFFDKDKAFISRDIVYNEIPRTVVTPDGAVYARVWVYVGSGVTQEVIDNAHIQLEAGDTATAFVPYQNAEYELNLGKNLFDKDNVNLYAGYFQASGVINGTNLTDLTSTTDRFFYIPCEPNTTYTITKPVQPTTRNNRFRVGTQSTLNLAVGAPLDDFWWMNDVQQQDITTHTITTGANARYLFVYFAKATTATNPGGEVQAILDGLQIEEGSIATSYAPYFDPIELCKIGNYQDKIYKEDGEWVLRKELKKVVLNGTEDWSFDDGSAQPFRTYLTDAAVLAPDQNTAPSVVSSHFIPYAWNTPVSSKSDFGVTVATNTEQNAKRIAVRFATISTREEFKTWLGNNLPSLYYPLGEPTETVISGELANQLDAIVSGGTYEGDTTFTVESAGNNLPALLQVKAIPQVDPNAAEKTQWYGAKKDPAEWTKTD